MEGGIKRERGRPPLEKEHVWFHLLNYQKKIHRNFSSPESQTFFFSSPNRNDSKGNTFLLVMG